MTDTDVRVLPAANESDRLTARNRSTAAAASYAKGNGGSKFSVRKVEGGLRVWRKPDEQEVLAEIIVDEVPMTQQEKIANLKDPAGLGIVRA